MVVTELATALASTFAAGTNPLGTPLWYLMLGTVIAVAGLVRLLLVRDLVARLIALNVTGAGSLLILLSLGARQSPADPVFSALVITGLVITVAFTGLGAVLIRRIEADSDEERPDPEAPPGRGDSETPDDPRRGDRR